MKSPILTLPRRTTRESYEAIRRHLRRCDGWDSTFRPISTWLDDRAKLKKKIEERRIGNKMALYQWGRDCDMCESDQATLVPASVMSFVIRWNSMHECAEGPCNMHVMTPEQYAEFEPSFRDRIAEAWDNGNTTPFMV